MSVGVWEPKKPERVELDKLRHLLEVFRQADPNDLQAVFDEKAIRDNAVLMKLNREAWDLAEDLGDEELNDLIRFFTLAEDQLPNWQAGETSPVIYLVRILRARDAFTPELRKWIKRHTDNRYLPYGPAL